MRPLPRAVTIVTALISVLLAGFALVAAAYIAFSLSTQDWYRDTFGGYATRLFVLYVLYALGVGGAAALALRAAWARRPAAMLSLLVAVLAGASAAGFLEFTFWSDLGERYAHGVLFLPLIGWTLVAFGR
ncbi:MAG: hypothetical protein ABI585_10870 [Betaproteobacteria bacterium]